VAEGDFAYLLGGKGNSPITVQELAAWWGSIPYELYCMLGAVNTRQYGGLI
jgi:Alanine racemase